MLKKFLIVIGGFIVVVASLVAVKASQIKEMSAAPHVAPLTAVSTFVAREVSWNPTINAIGTLAPVEGVMLSTDADGTITEILAASGAAVQAGELLLKFDTSVEVAQLASAEARAELARLQSARALDLLRNQTISQAEVDTATAQLNQALAEVAALKAQIAKKEVRAPFAGRVGIRLINVGQFVARGAPLLPLQRLDPIFVNFSIPQRLLPSVKMGQHVVVNVDAFEGRDFTASITAINSQVDPTTRNIAIQGTMENPGEILRAGMFVRVAVELPTGGTRVAVPATAIAYASYGNSVYVVEKLQDDAGNEYLGARQQFVKLGPTRGDLVAVVDGLQPGEEVVSAGVFKLRNAQHVQVNNSVQPTSSAHPTPDNT